MGPQMVFVVFLLKLGFLGQNKHPGDYFFFVNCHLGVSGQGGVIHKVCGSLEISAGLTSVFKYGGTLVMGKITNALG